MYEPTAKMEVIIFLVSTQMIMKNKLKNQITYKTDCLPIISAIIPMVKLIVAPNMKIQNWAVT